MSRARLVQIAHQTDIRGWQPVGVRPWWAATRWSTGVSFTLQSRVLRDQICTKQAPKVNCGMQLDFWWKGRTPPCGWTGRWTGLIACASHINKLVSNQHYYTFTLILLTKIVLCSKFPWTKFINYQCFGVRSTVGWSRPRRTPTSRCRANMVHISHSKPDFICKDVQFKTFWHWSLQHDFKNITRKDDAVW